MGLYSALTVRILTKFLAVIQFKPIQTVSIETTSQTAKRVIRVHRSGKQFSFSGSLMDIWVSSTVAMVRKSPG